MVRHSNRMKVTLSPIFAQHLKNFPKHDRETILTFINHVDDEIILVDLDFHPPFNLPAEDKLTFNQS